MPPVVHVHVLTSLHIKTCDWLRFIYFYWDFCTDFRPCFQTLSWSLDETLMRLLGSDSMVTETCQNRQWHEHSEPITARTILSMRDRDRVPHGRAVEIHERDDLLTPLAPVPSICREAVCTRSSPLECQHEPGVSGRDGPALTDNTRLTLISNIKHI